MILILGSMARKASSKRTWSFPLPYGALLAIEPSLRVVSIRPPCCLALPAEFHRPAVPVCGTLPSRHRLDGLLELLAQYVGRAGAGEAVGVGEQTWTLGRGNKASFKDPRDLFDWLSRWRVAGLAVEMVLLQSPHIGLEVAVPTVHP
jgi:hypothetical protein